jgi:hypothetical protein
MSLLPPSAAIQKTIDASRARAAADRVEAAADAQRRIEAAVRGTR